MSVFTYGMCSFDEGREDSVLVRARRREPEALAALCEQFYPKVLKYMRYRVGEDDAEDLAGEVFLRVMRAVGDQKGSFVAWLYTIARNVVTDHRRRRKVHKEVSLDDEMLAGIEAKDDQRGSVERRMVLESVLPGLTEDQREFVTLKFMQELSNKEIGKIMSRKEGALRVLQFRSLCALRKAVLEGQGAG